MIITFTKRIHNEKSNDYNENICVNTSVYHYVKPTYLCTRMCIHCTWMKLQDVTIVTILVFVNFLLDRAKFITDVSRSIYWQSVEVSRFSPLNPPNKSRRYRVFQKFQSIVKKQRERERERERDNNNNRYSSRRNDNKKKKATKNLNYQYVSLK